MKSKILISINPGDSLPIYRQIVEQVKAGIASGVLKGSDKLPSHRDLARELLIAPLTVKKAYDTLESEGCLEYQRGRGTFIKQQGGSVNQIALGEFDAKVQSLVHQAKILGFDQKQVTELINKRWHRTDGGQHE